MQIVDPGIGAWGYRMAPADKDGDSIPAITMDGVLDRVGTERLGLLKLDIEGAEYDVLTNPQPWIERVDVVAAELHESFAR